MTKQIPMIKKATRFRESRIDPHFRFPKTPFPPNTPALTTFISILLLQVVYFLVPSSTSLKNPTLFLSLDCEI